MTRLNVNPTRMELKKLKARLATAVRGHKLLKDKSDEMIRRFTVIIKENKSLREQAERELGDCLKQFSTAVSGMSAPEMEKAFSFPVSGVQAEFDTADVMSVVVPKITVKENTSKAVFPYAFTEITSEADYSIERVGKVLGLLLRLAESEKTAAMLAIEIERNKRRVNALEYIMIPQIEETIKYIKSKLDENERAAVTRLMKVKDMLANQQ
ncbi:MAG: V-type ATP synthase subunit D [Candidatus Neoclostridium sp.]